jgi:hypothetical protein
MEKAPLSAQHAIIVHHEEIRRRIKTRYSLTDIRELQAFLEQRGTLTFKPLTTGL